MGNSKTGKRIALLAGCVVVVVVAAVSWRYREHIRFWWLFESMGKNEQGFQEFRHRQTGIVFVNLPGGKFLMGSPETEDREEGPAETELQHKVTLTPFMIGKYEVTQAEWARIMKYNPSSLKGENLPVEEVLWEDCKRFCEKTGLQLPTEARWEYACRAGTTSPFAFGENITTNQVNYDGNHPYLGGQKGEWRKKTVPVDSFKPNDFGIYQMHGNVWEYCEDVFRNNFYSMPEATMTDPICTPPGIPVMRGGSWGYYGGWCRSAFRMCWRPEHRRGDIGFRVCWPPLPPGEG